MLKTLGDQEEGIAAYRRCIELEPDSGEAYYSLANLKIYRFDEATIEQMQGQLERAALNNTSRVNFLFALGKAFEDRKDYTQSWHYYEEGNAKQRMLVRYDPVQTETINDALIAFFNASFFHTTAGLGHPE